MDLILRIFFHNYRSIAPLPFHHPLKLDNRLFHDVLELLATPPPADALETIAHRQVGTDKIHPFFFTPDLTEITIPFPRLPDSLLLVSPFMFCRTLGANADGFLASIDDRLFVKRAERALAKHPGLASTLEANTNTLLSFRFSCSKGFHYTALAPCAAALIPAASVESTAAAAMKACGGQLTAVCVSGAPLSLSPPAPPSLPRRLLGGLFSLFFAPSPERYLPCPSISLDRLRELHLRADLLVLASPHWNVQTDDLARSVCHALQDARSIVIQQPVWNREIGGFESAALRHFPNVRHASLSTGKPGAEARVLQGLRDQAGSLERLSIFLGPMAEGEPSSCLFGSLCEDLPNLTTLDIAITLETIDEAVIHIPSWLQRLSVLLPPTSFHVPQFNLFLPSLSDCAALDSVQLEGFSTLHLKAFLLQLAGQDERLDEVSASITDATASFRLLEWEFTKDMQHLAAQPSGAAVTAISTDAVPLWRGSRLSARP